MAGYIKLHRGWRDNEIFDAEYSRADAWVWLIENACWKPSKARIKGSSVALQRGELTFSQRFMAAKWKWSKSRVDRFISELRLEGMIETRSKIGASVDHKAGQGQSVIFICNYDKYQSNDDDARGNSEPQNGATAGQQRGKEEEGNKYPKGASPDSDKVFWANAVSFLGESKRSMVGRWCSQFGQPDTARAITEAQLNRAADPVPYIERILRRGKVEAAEMPIC